MTTELLIAIYVYVAWCFVNVAVAGEKNRMGPFVFFGSFVLTPLLIYLYLLAVPAKPKTPAANRYNLSG